MRPNQGQSGGVGIADIAKICRMWAIQYMYIHKNISFYSIAFKDSPHRSPCGEPGCGRQHVLLLDHAEHKRYGPWPLAEAAVRGDQPASNPPLASHQGFRG